MVSRILKIHFRDKYRMFSGMTTIQFALYHTPMFDFTLSPKNTDLKGHREENPTIVLLNLYQNNTTVVKLFMANINNYR